MKILNINIADSSNYFFINESEKEFARLLILYIVTGVVPKTTPELWQNVEMYIRYLKRDLWILDDNVRDNINRSILAYRIKYIAEQFTVGEITKFLNEFFQKEGEIRLLELFSKKFHASIDDLILTQEKRVITKEDIKDFDKIFTFPAWIDFDKEALEAIFKKIENNELSDTQIDYFLGASDNIEGYDKWFKAAKHILMTTNNSHTFWTAGDVLSIIRKAVPHDKVSQKWFDDQIFEIFWPRVNSAWPILNQEEIDFEKNEKSRIMRDSIGWLSLLDDLKERVPELGKDYEPSEKTNDEDQFSILYGFILAKIESKETTGGELMDQYFKLTDYVCNEETLRKYKRLADEKLIPALGKFEDTIDIPKALSTITDSIKHSEKYIKTLNKERENIAKNLVKTEITNE